MCECSHTPLCRYHHRAEHSQGWRLEQPEPGIFVWVTPFGADLRHGAREPGRMTGRVIAVHQLPGASPRSW